MSVYIEGYKTEVEHHRARVTVDFVGDYEDIKKFVYRLHGNPVEPETLLEDVEFISLKEMML